MENVPEVVQHDMQLQQQIIREGRKAARDDGERGALLHLKGKTLQEGNIPDHLSRNIEGDDLVDQDEIVENDVPPWEVQPPAEERRKGKSPVNNKPRNYKRWSVEEKMAVERHLGLFIASRKVPGKNDSIIYINQKPVI
ncbi:hypothetical protein ElyMa_000557100 [Elysia marginata]|uniref:Myb-like domain-containing protein n=1 Tax=Elysia marginata TaxID=1093978 RepID=A0AAV4G185_9GAST|nr:hypothetical protein ElyMa_000557100 [Elysia marginata]